jgi:hypothetical protein
MLEQVAKRLASDVFSRTTSPKCTVFLCGKSLDDTTSLRHKIANQFKNELALLLRYTLVFPEDIFEELLSGPFHKDLLTLENLLADSVDVIVLIPESAGSIAELGAFANHERLRQKLVCVQEERYRKEKSFINYGPVRLLRDLHVGKVVDVDAADIPQAIDRIKKGIAAIRKTPGTAATATVNAINADRFLLPCVYLFEPVDFDTLQELVRHASNFSAEESAAIVTAGLSVLRKHERVIRTPDGCNFTNGRAIKTAEGFRLTENGMLQFRQMNARGRWGHYFNISALDEMRVDLLTLMYRKPRRERP